MNKEEIMNNIDYLLNNAMDEHDRIIYRRNVKSDMFYPALYNILWHYNECGELVDAYIDRKNNLMKYELEGLLNNIEKFIINKR